LNLSFIIKETKIKLSIKEFIFKPVLSVIVMGASVILCTYLFRSMHYAISTLMSILIGAIVYFAVIFILKTVKYEEILMLPKGDKLATIMLKFGIITK
jgi:stage V sporulation protein B